MTRLTFSLALIVACAAAAIPGAPAAHKQSDLCVGHKPGCFTTIQAAVDAAHDGDTIAIGPGTYAGPVTIDVSVDVRGAGAGATTIQGGGPVVTIGAELASTEPTVSLSGVTITGGVNDSFPDPAVTQGGGVRIPQGSFPDRNGLGATVTISDSVIVGNTVASQALLPAGFCGPFDCSFASGGGIWSAGTLTLIDTRVSGNQAGDPSSMTVVAGAGGVAGNFQGTLTMKHCVVADNRAVGTPPLGDTASAAGVDAHGALAIEDSIVSGNSAQLSTDDPTDEFPLAFAGGIGIGGQATITRTAVRDNGVTVSNVGGQALAVAGGILDEGSLVLTHAAIERNRASATVPDSSHDAALAGAGGMEVDGAAAISDSRFGGNSVSANAPAGSASAVGGGISNFGQTTLERTLVTANTASASGATGFVHGGGILERHAVRVDPEPDRVRHRDRREQARRRPRHRERRAAGSTRRSRSRSRERRSRATGRTSASAAESAPVAERRRAIGGTWLNQTPLTGIKSTSSGRHCERLVPRARRPPHDRAPLAPAE